MCEYLTVSIGGMMRELETDRVREKEQTVGLWKLQDNISRICGDLGAEFKKTRSQPSQFIEMNRKNCD